VVDGPRQAARRVLPAELVRLLEADAVPAQDSAWDHFLSSFHKLILFAVRSTEENYDLVMDRYTYVLEHLREDDFRRLRAFQEKGRAKFSTWLVVVVRRLVIDHQRGQYGRNQHLASQDDPESQTSRRRLAERVSSAVDVSQLRDPTTVDSVRSLHRVEIREALSEVLGTLPPGDQLLLSLRFQDEMTARGIAEIMGFPSPFHVYRRLKKVLNALKAELKARGFEESGI
jgi:RNA polymerase sigma factor (sigma-70 family)